MADGLLQGKRGVVMGIANDKSIAWACAQVCSAAGAELAFNYLGPLEKRVRKLAESLPGSPPILECDVSSDESIAAFFSQLEKEWGSIDFIIHSIAFAERDDLKNPFVETPRDHFKLALDISAYSLVAVTRAALPLMSEGGSIITMTYYGAEKVVPHYNVMGVAKAALEASARYLAYELGEKGVRVNCISAGPLRTLSASAIPGLRSMLSASGGLTPMRRNITADEVGKTALYLLSDLSSGVTGETLHVDCGYNILGMFASEEGAQNAEAGA